MDYFEAVRFIDWIATEATTLEEARERAERLRVKIQDGYKDICGIGVSSEAYERIRSFIRQHNNINAIRTLRSCVGARGFSLRQLKEIIERFATIL